LSKTGKERKGKKRKGKEKLFETERLPPYMIEYTI
jgi:hypothetical protein